MSTAIQSQSGSMERTFPESLSRSSNLLTPAFVYHQDIFIDKMDLLAGVRNQAGCRVLFPLKCFSFMSIFRSVVEEQLDGFSVSSLFEARLAADLSKGIGFIHMTSPGLRPDEVRELSHLCDHISFNSMPQYERLGGMLWRPAQCGVRVNPQLSFADDPRYDPCRRHSHLGVSLDQFARLDVSCLKGIGGILIHNNCESRDWRQLYQTVTHLMERVPQVFEHIRWINLGGGYLFEQATDLRPLVEITDLLKKKYGLEVLIEPGHGTVADAGFIVTKVIDLFQSDGKMIAVLDTTVNHMPGVFAYQKSPVLLNGSDKGDCSYILSGSSCLAGDTFGEFKFNKPLEIGSQIIFKGMGAYTLVKANMFNGINLPSIYSYAEGKGFKLEKNFTYADYMAQYAGGQR